MVVSIALEQLGFARKAVREAVRGLKVIDDGSEKESDITWAVGEAFANCVEHGGCSEADVEVAMQEGDVVVEIKASCYQDPEKVKSWFGRPGSGTDLDNSRGRGDCIILSLVKEMECKPGLVRLIFDPLAVHRTPMAAA